MRTRSALEVFAAFLKLGLTSFGGPIAHVAYFRHELIERRQWLREEQYAHLLALCHVLPGPTSSQTGFALGWLRAGWRGAIAAWIGFTLPSAVLMFAFAKLIPSISVGTGQSALHGLKLAALCIVAQAVVEMGRRLCTTATRVAIAALSTALMLLFSSQWTQLLVIAVGAVAGLLLCRDTKPVSQNEPFSGSELRNGWVPIALFVALLILLPVTAQSSHGIFAIVDVFYRAGALVFGGGHVVLPLLHDLLVTPALISQDDFVAGYGAAQAVPGPLFTIATYLGARIAPEQALLVAAVATVSIFLPGLLLVAGMFPLWRAVVERPFVLPALAGVNAAVVGLVAAALYNPVWTSAVHGVSDVAIALAAFLLLVLRRAPAWIIVILCVVAGVVQSLL